MDTNLGTGLYTVSEVARLTGLNTARVRRWTAGYSYRTEAATHRMSPLITRRSEDGKSLTFLDLVEILFVKAFLEHGVTMHTIRLAVAKAAELFGTHHPFCVKKFETDGRTVFARLGDEITKREHMIDLVQRQAVFSRIVSPFLKQLDFDVAGDVLRWWPMGRRLPVVVDPAISFGAPVTAVGHVPTFALHATLCAGESLSRVAEWYDVPKRAVNAAKTFEKRLAA